MNTHFNRLLFALNQEISQLSMDRLQPIERHKKAVLLCKKAMVMVKQQLTNDCFVAVEEEIEFFKSIKPGFYSQYIYYVGLFNFYMQRPVGGEDIQRSYIDTHLAEIKTFFDHNRAFYAYYRSGMSQLDEIYYTRKAITIHAELDDFEEDVQFSTSHDYKLSKIIANERLQDYFRLELLRLGQERTAIADGQRILPFKHPQWTAGQTDAVELLYSLKTSAAVNHGNIDISELVGIFEFIFQMDLNETYHKLLDITRRKKDPLVFLSRMRNCFENFIQEKFS